MPDKSYRYFADRRYQREHPAPSWGLPVAFTLVLLALVIIWILAR